MLSNIFGRPGKDEAVERRVPPPPPFPDTGKTVGEANDVVEEKALQAEPVEEKAEGVKSADVEPVEEKSDEVEFDIVIHLRNRIKKSFTLSISPAVLTAFDNALVAAGDNVTRKQIIAMAVSAIGSNVNLAAAKGFAEQIKSLR